jgi:hypothetical protein
LGNRGGSKRKRKSPVAAAESGAQQETGVSVPTNSAAQDHAPSTSCRASSETVRIQASEKPMREVTRFVALALDDFLGVLDRLYLERRIESLHLHVTGHPNHSEDRGERTVRAMARFHTEHCGLSDLAQHLTIDSHGTIWTGRSWERPPVSVSGWNGTNQAGPLMIVLIGDFRTGADQFAGLQRDAVAWAVACLEEKFSLSESSFRLAWRMSPNLVPGDQIEQSDLRSCIDHARLGIRKDRRKVIEPRLSPFPDSAIDRGAIDDALEVIRDSVSLSIDSIEEMPSLRLTDDELLLLINLPQRHLFGHEIMTVNSATRSKPAASGDGISVKGTTQVLHDSGEKIAVSVTEGKGRNAAMFQVYEQKARGGERSGESRGGSKKALCIGIDAYRTKPLRGCVNDARAWAKALERMGFSSELMLNQAATKNKILDGIRQLVENSRSGDVLVIQYSGHGTQVPDRGTLDESDGLDEALVPVDVEQRGFVVDDDLAVICNGIPEGVNVTFFMDCCHSGTITRLFAGVDQTEADDVRTRFIVPTEEMLNAHFRTHRAIARSAQRSPYSGQREILFSACQSNQTAKERGGQGDFTRFALQVLQRNSSGRSNSDFVDAVRSIGRFEDQRPQLWSDQTLWDAPMLGLVAAASPIDSPTPETAGGSKLDDLIAQLEAIVGGLRSAQRGGDRAAC